MTMISDNSFNEIICFHLFDFLDRSDDLFALPCDNTITSSLLLKKLRDTHDQLNGFSGLDKSAEPQNASKK